MSLKKLLAAFLFLLLSSPAIAAVTNYKPIVMPFYRDGRLMIAIRTFEQDSDKKVLILDPYSFDTTVMEADCVDLNRSRGIGLKHLYETPFYNALETSTAEPVKLQNHGVTRALAIGKKHRVFVTIDMCPSEKPFEKRLFEALAGLPEAGSRPTPIAIAVSGSWIKQHPDEFKWLLKMIETKKLDVTWINHTFSHPYDKKAGLKENFILKKGVDVEKEVLVNEVLLLESGITPSVFFRFPGLVADLKAMETIKGLSLIPIGSSAWLSKGERPVDNGFILVHGNGNEPGGVKRLLRFLDRKKNAFKNNELTLDSLKNAFLTDNADKIDNPAR